MTDEPPRGDPFTLPITEPQPSQLYLNGRKLSLATQWFDFDDPAYDPIPVRRFDGEWVLLDGHTRAFLAALSGADDLHVVENHEDLSMAIYGECVSWCREEGITEISDLHGRALNADSFVEQWVERCHTAAERLDGESDQS